MLPQYIVVTGAPVVTLLNNNCHVFNVSVHAAGGQTVEVAVEDVPNAATAPASPGPTWVAAPASPLGANFYAIQVPVRLLRISGAGTATVLQQGIQ